MAEYTGLEYNDEGVLKMNIRRNGNISIIFSETDRNWGVFTYRFEEF